MKNPLKTSTKNEQNQANNRPFLTDVQELRRRAREHIKCGALTAGYEGDVDFTIQILNEALATEIVCTLRYKNHYYLAEGINSQSVAAEFLEHAREEEQHADQLAKRIKELGGRPNYNPEGILTRSHSEFQVGETLVEMIEEDLIAERIAIDSYREMARYFGEKDPTTRRLLEEILAKEEEHADELSSLLLTLDPTKRPSAA